MIGFKTHFKSFSKSTRNHEQQKHINNNIVIQWHGIVTWNIKPIDKYSDWVQDHLWRVGVTLQGPGWHSNQSRLSGILVLSAVIIKILSILIIACSWHLRSKIATRLKKTYCCCNWAEYQAPVASYWSMKITWHEHRPLIGQLVTYFSVVSVSLFCCVRPPERDLSPGDGETEASPVKEVQVRSLCG